MQMCRCLKITFQEKVHMYVTLGLEKFNLMNFHFCNCPIIFLIPGHKSIFLAKQTCLQKLSTTAHFTAWPKANWTKLKRPRPKSPYKANPPYGIIAPSDLQTPLPFSPLRTPLPIWEYHKPWGRNILELYLKGRTKTKLIKYRIYFR